MSTIIIFRPALDLGLTSNNAITTNIMTLPTNNPTSVSGPAMDSRSRTRRVDGVLSLDLSMEMDVWNITRMDDSNVDSGVGTFAGITINPCTGHQDSEPLS